VTAAAPDPRTVRAATVNELYRLGLPVPPPEYPLVWEPGDQVGLRSRGELEDRTAVLTIVLARAFGLPAHRAMAWLLDGGLVDRMSPPESRFVIAGEGDSRVFSLHLEAVYALAWVLGIALDLDPLYPSAEGLMEWLPNLPAGETYAQWRSRTLTAPREPAEVATVLDRYYCLDWAYLEAERQALRLPGEVDSNAIGQRRWALEWAVVFTGPYHDPPAGWEEIDLST
jgi:Domain of unknown function (DUF4272)